MPRLIIAGPGGDDRVHELVDDVTSIGRGSSNIIQIKDKESSRKHCRIERDGDTFRLVDLGSRNGTELNGAKVEKQTLRPNDVIVIGDYRFTYQAPDQVADEDLEATVDVAPISEKDLAVAPASAGPREKPQYVLEVTEGPDKGKTFDLGTETLTVGRSNSNKYRIDDESASSYHCEISKEPTGYFVTDLGSTNGTRVNGEKIVKTRLGPGAEIQIGMTKILFKNVGGAAEEDEVFGTVVLDTERLERELAADELAARAAFVRRLGAGIVALIVIGAAVWGVLALVNRGGAVETSVPGNRLPNPSFSGELTSRGDPDGWRSTGAALVSWKVDRQADRIPEKERKSTLVVSRSAEAALDAYTECSTAAPLDLVAGRAYELGGWVRAEGARGIYGLRVRWRESRGEREAVDQVYVAGSQSDWRELARVFSPPGWATQAKVACFAYGNMGDVVFDDVYFVQTNEAPAVDASRLGAAFGQMRIEPTHTGTFGVKSGTESAARGGEFFVVDEGGAKSDQTIADAEDPAADGSTSVFGGTIPTFYRDERVLYRERLRPGGLGVVAEYEVSSDQPLALRRAGLRFTLTGRFARGDMQVFNENGEPVEGVEGAFEGGRELVLTADGGEKLVLYVRGEAPAMHVEPLGNEKLVEVLLPGGAALSRAPAKIAVEFNTSSRFARKEADDLWKEHEAAVRDADIERQKAVLARISALGERYPNDKLKADETLARMEAKVEADFRPVRALLVQHEVASGVMRETLQTQIAREIEKLRNIYRTGKAAQDVDILERELAGQKQRAAQKARDAEGEKLLGMILDGIEHENFIFVERWWAALERDFADTPAFERAQQNKVKDMIEEKKRAGTEREAAYVRLKRVLDNFIRNGKYQEALDFLNGSAEFQRYRSYPKFKALLDEVKGKL